MKIKSKIIVGLMLCAFAFVSVGCKKSKNGIDENYIQRGYFVYYGKDGGGFHLEGAVSDSSSLDYAAFGLPHCFIKKIDIPLRFRKKGEIFYVEVYFSGIRNWDIEPDYIKLKYIKEIE